MAKDRVFDKLIQFLLWILLGIEFFWVLNLSSLYFAPSITEQTVPRPHYVASTLLWDSEIYQGVAYTEEEAVNRAIDAMGNHLILAFACLLLTLVAVVFQRVYPMMRNICGIASLILFIFVLFIL